MIQVGPIISKIFQPVGYITGCCYIKFILNVVSMSQKEASNPNPSCTETKPSLELLELRMNSYDQGIGEHKLKKKKTFLLLCKCKNESWKRHGVYNQQKIRWKWWSSSLSKVGNDKIGWIGRGSTGSQFSNKWTSIVLFLDARGFWDYLTWRVLIMAIGYQILAPK